MCATHPWRVVLGWVGIVVVLIVLVATIGGELKDEFEIPGSDTQRATDLIESEFAAEQGGVLNLVFAAPRGRAARHAGAPGRDRGGDREAADRRVRADRGRGRDRERRRPVRREHVLRRRAHRLRRGAVRPRHLRGGPRGRRRRAGRRPRDGRAGRGDGRVQRRRRVPADRAGNAGAARPARGADRAARRLPHLRRDVDPDRARADRARDRVPAALHPRRPDRDQHDHAAARVDDRARRRDRLLAVHRHALQTAPARGAVAGRRRRRGRRLRRPGRALRRADGRDLGHRPRLLRPRLRDEARHRLGARRADDGADRELAADRGAGEARAQGRPAEGAVPAAARRLRGGARADADRPLGPVRDRERAGRVRRRARSSASALAATSALVRLGASDQGTQPKEQTARRAYDLLAEGFGAGFNGPIPIVVDVNGDPEAPQRIYDGVAGPRGRRLGRRAAVRTTRRRSRSSS